MFGAVIRFIVSALVLLVTAAVVPGFELTGFWNALLAALAIALIGYIVEAVLGDEVSPQSRGLIGFISAAAVIYAVQFIVGGVSVTLVGALLASLVIGLIDAVVPTQLR